MQRKLFEQMDTINKNVQELRPEEVVEPLTMKKIHEQINFDYIDAQPEKEPPVPAKVIVSCESCVHIIDTRPVEKRASRCYKKDRIRKKTFHVRTKWW
jgi:hypothetical protein